MTQKQTNLIRRVYGVALSVLTVVAAILLITQSQRIYRSADISPYSREKVIYYLSQISAVLYVWIAAVIIGAILWQIFPPEDTKLKASTPKTVVAKRLEKKLGGNSNKRLDEINLIDKIVFFASIGVCILCAVMTAVCVWNKDNYTPVGNGFDPTKDMLAMLPKILPWVILAFATVIAATIRFELAAKVKVDEIKKIMTEKAKTPDVGTIEPTRKSRVVEIFTTIKTTAVKIFDNEKFVFCLRCAVLIFGVSFVVLGCFNGGALEMLEKAINICTECIGLG